jgi:hypothetical protein
MKRMSAFSLFVLTILVCSPAFGQITTSAGSADMAQTVFDILTLLFVLIACYIAMELHHIMKGGELASSWSSLAGAVWIFALLKMIELAGKAEFFPVSDVLLAAGYMVVAIFLFYGFLKQRKTLS